jgi:hypothetical protein
VKHRPKQKPKTKTVAEKVTDKLASVLETFLTRHTAIGQNSHKTWDGSRFVWNDEVWKRADYDGFILAQRARAALVAYRGLQPRASTAKRA